MHGYADIFHLFSICYSLLNQDVRSSIQPVELQVTNLDQNIEQREMKRTITSIFREHVPILHVSVFFQSDGNMAASVRVPTPQDAQYAISQLHRKKVHIISTQGFLRFYVPMYFCNSVLLNRIEFCYTPDCTSFFLCT